MVDLEISSNAERIARQRLYLAEFMDDNAATFAAPVAADSWVGFAHTGQMAKGPDRQVVDKALGMLVGVMRAAQLSFGQSQSIGDAYARAREAGIPDYEPDAHALTITSPDENEADREAYAQTVTIYKQFIEEGVLDRDDLARSIDKALDDLPGNTPLMRSLIDTARRIALLDVEYTLGPRR
jgi:hypothetical protein